MDKLFLQILNMSLTASLVIIFVLVARFLLKKAPKILSYSLWSVVLFRLICPFSFESMLSLLPTNSTPIPMDIGLQAVPKIDSGISAVNNAVNSLLPPATQYGAINDMQIFTIIGTILWIFGIAVLLIYGTTSLYRLKLRLKNATHINDNTYEAEDITTPFVLGFIKPKIYIPKGLNNNEQSYILAHEKNHIRRLDYIVKPIAFLVLCVHWFNPLVWLAFAFMSKDMEMSCDEAVLNKLGSEIKCDYSSSLLTLSSAKSTRERLLNGLMLGSPLAFGESDAKSRIKNVLSYKKPVFWITCVALLAAIAVAIGLLANPKSTINLVDIGFSAEQFEKVTSIDIKGSEGITTLTDEKEIAEVISFIKEIKINKTEVDKSRDEDRDSTNKITFNTTNTTNVPYKFHINISRDFSQIWYDNEIKPSFSYKLKDKNKLMEYLDMFYASDRKAVFFGDTSADLIEKFKLRLLSRDATGLSRLNPEEAVFNKEEVSKWLELKVSKIEALKTNESDNKVEYKLEITIDEAPAEFGIWKVGKVTHYLYAQRGNMGWYVAYYSDSPLDKADAWWSETEPNSSYQLQIFENGDAQLSINNTAEFSELGKRNEGFAYLEKQTNQLHVGITTEIGQPVATEENPVGSLAGAAVKLDMDILTGKLISSSITKPDLLKITDERLTEIGNQLYLILKKEMEIKIQEKSQSAIIDELNKSDTLAKSGVAITSLADWNKLNAENKLTENCYNFFYNLLSGKSEIEEYNTVIIKDYEISFAQTPEDSEISYLNFDFTVESSGLEALPPGKYHRVVSDIIDCYMDDAINGSLIWLDYLGKFRGVEEAKMVEKWIGSMYLWDCPKFGEAKSSNVNYIIEQYGNNGDFLLEDFIKLSKEKFGVEITDTKEYDGLILEKDGVKYITPGGMGGTSAYLVKDCFTKDDVTTVTVQFYADCNLLIPSHLVAYKIKKSGIWLGYELLKESKNPPYGLQKLYS